MCSHPGPIPELHLISIDNFEMPKNKNSTCFFLTHCHTDHMIGLKTPAFISHFKKHPTYRLYCSSISRLILSTFHQLKEITEQVQELNIGYNNVVVCEEEEGGRPYNIGVTCIPAGHCPGSVMFLFETHQQRILFTGDFRFAIGDTQKIKYFSDGTYVKPIDKIYLDGTFLHESFYDFANRNESIEFIIKKIQEWLDADPENQVQMDMTANYGGEHIITRVSQHFKCKVHVLSALYEMYLRVPEVRDHLTDNCDTTRIHSQTRTKNRDCTLRKVPEQKLLKIKPKAAPFKCCKGEMPPQASYYGYNNISANYSSHSSYSEIVDFISYLRPNKVEVFTDVYLSSAKEATEKMEELLIMLRDPPELVSSKPKRARLDEAYVPRQFSVSNPFNSFTDKDLD